MTEFKVGDKVINTVTGLHGIVLMVDAEFVYVYKETGACKVYSKWCTHLIKESEKNVIDKCTEENSENQEKRNMDKKDTNPKDSVGSRKISMANVPIAVLMEVALGMQEGALKYTANNWRFAGVRSSVYYDAALRHLMAWFGGEDIDPDSGISHVSKAISCLCVLRDAQIHDMENDDRPPKAKVDFKELNSKAAALCDKYASSSTNQNKA